MPDRILEPREEKVFESLDEPFASKARRVFYQINRRLKDHMDCYAVVRDGYRTPDEQLKEYLKGRKQLSDGTFVVVGKVSTYALPQLAPHCYRRAVHIVLLDNARTAIKSDDHWLADGDKRWSWIGLAAANVGVTWGGNFKTLRDMAHIEDPDWRVTAKRRGSQPMLPHEPRG